MNVHVNAITSHHNKLAELENIRELFTHSLFEMLSFGLGHLSIREIKHFFTIINGKDYDYSHLTGTTLAKKAEK